MVKASERYVFIEECFMNKQNTKRVKPNCSIKKHNPEIIQRFGSNPFKKFCNLKISNNVSYLETFVGK